MPASPRPLPSSELSVVDGTANGNASGIAFKGLDPALGSLGIMAGALRCTDEATEAYELIPSWFENPYGNAKAGFTQNPRQLGDLLSRLLGEMGGNATGIPTTDPTILGSWYPIELTDKATGKKKPTGLYIVSIDNVDEHQVYQSTALGLGVLRKWAVPGNEPLVSVDVWATLPVVVILPDGTFELTFTYSGNVNPITLGLAVEGVQKDSPLVQENGIEFNGLKINANLFLQPDLLFDLGVEVLALQLADDPEPKNYSLADLAAISPQEILETISQLFVGAMAKEFPGASDQLLFLAPLFGLAPHVPVLDRSIPVLQWFDLLEIVSQGGDPARPFIDWFNALTNDPPSLRAWMGSLAAVLGQSVTATTVSGNGSQSQPFSTPLLIVDGVGALAFTAASQVVDGGARFFYPGLSFRSEAVALGTSDASFVAEADLDLAKFQLSGTSSAEADLNFRANFALEGKAGGKLVPADNPLGLSVGRMSGGLELALLSGAVVPHLELIDLVLPPQSVPLTASEESAAPNEFGVVNLLSPGQLAEVGAVAISAELQKLLGLDQADPSIFAQSLAALIGLVRPTGATNDWPICPFSEAGMPHSIRHPIDAWADYYLEVLQTPAQNGTPRSFTYLLRSFASMLKMGDMEVVLTGDGTATNPWLLGIAAGTETMPAYLSSFETIDPLTGAVSLTFGLELAPLIQTDGLTIQPTLGIDAVRIDFVSGAAATAEWMERVFARLTLPEKVSTPSLNGAVFSVESAALNGGWSRSSGWTWTMHVEQPSLTLGTAAPIVGADLDYSQQSSLAELVTGSAATFGPFFRAVAGATLMRTGTRAGLLVAATTGLLTDFSSYPIYQNSGLDWTGFTLLPLDSFSDPLGLLRRQLAANLSTPERVRSQLALISWSLTGAAEAPAIVGEGTFDLPYLTPLPGGITLAVWYDATTEVLGVAVGNVLRYAYPTASPACLVEVISRLNILEYNLGTGSIVPHGNSPSLSLEVSLGADAGAILPMKDRAGGVNTIALGFSYDLSSGVSSLHPIATLYDATLPGAEEARTITLSDYQGNVFTEQERSGYLTLLNAGLQFTFDHVKDKELFQEVYTVLEIMGLVNPAPDLGINSGGWSALLASPLTFVEARIPPLLEQYTQQQEMLRLVELAQTLTGLDLTAVYPLPEAAIDLLRGLGILQDEAHFNAIDLSAVVAIANNPIGSLYDRFRILVTDEEALSQLASDLVKNTEVQSFGPFTIVGTSNGLVTLAIPADQPLEVGELLQLSGGLSLDITAGKMTGLLATYLPSLDLTLSNALGIALTNGTVVAQHPSVILYWGNRTAPAAPPLTLWPFNSTIFLQDVSYLAPVYALQSVLTAVIEDGLLTKYPVAQSALEVFGIAYERSGRWEMTNLLGLFLHPLDWLLSDRVLGTDGHFSVEKLLEKLTAFPAASYQPGGWTTPLQIGPNDTQTGLSISGLPYTFSVTIEGDRATGSAAFRFGASHVEIAGSKGSLDDLIFVVELSKAYQASVRGSMELSTTVGTELFATVGFDRDFQLSVTSGTPSSPHAKLQLLPFLGWGSLGKAVGSFAAAEVIDIAIPRILDALRPGAPKIVTALESFGADVPVAALLQDITKAITGGGTQTAIRSRIEATSLQWLSGLFTDGTQLPKTTRAVQAIFEAVPSQVGRVVVDASSPGLLVYSPGEALPFRILFGMDGHSNLGLWVTLTIPELDYLKISVARTGVGVDTATFKKVAFDFGLEVVIPLDSNTGPGLFLEHDATNMLCLCVDPVSDTSQPGVRSKYAVELVPVFFGTGGQPPADLGRQVSQWLEGILKDVVPRYLSVLLLNNEKVLSWLEYDLFSPLSTTTAKLTPIDLLTATTLVVEHDQRYALNSFAEVAKITPLTFLANFTQELVKEKVRILQIGDSGSIWLQEDPGRAGSYGVRLVAPDLEVAALPNFVLQLGANDTDWIQHTAATAGTDVQPGIQFYVPIDADPVAIHFSDFHIILGNIGFDAVGIEGKPIVDLSRFQLGALQPRVLLDLKYDQGSPSVAFGGNLTLADIALSLAPDQLPAGSAGSSNPIASNLLGSGSSDSGNSQNPPVNPTFSIQAAYTDHIWVNLVSSTGEGKEIIIPVQRGFGPLYIGSLGLGWNDTEPEAPLLDLLFTGNVALAGLDIALIGLDLGIPVTHPTDYSAYQLSLAGLDVSYKGGAVEIGAGLLYTETDEGISYNGSAVIKAGPFSLIAMGSYAQVTSGGDKATSLFIFAALNTPLGGLPAFFVTGLAAGFGYNRSLLLPPVEEVVSFEMVAGVLDGTLTESNDPGTALAHLSEVVPPRVGEYWLAAGLKFRSFELINTAALIFVKFGKEFEIDILALSYAALPPELAKVNALAYFELAIKAAFKPAVGILSVEAQLTPNSFVLAKDCKVTGGFALYLWYKDTEQTIDGKVVHIPKGQFVVTLGGYHPLFQPPAYYPQVPRLGIQWHIAVSVGKLSIDGGAYFAICPTAVMAGGYLRVLFVAGPLKAWLDAYANFLIEWKPFYFDVAIGVTIGASFGFKVAGVSITVTAELNATLNLAGPPVNGEVHVDWLVISFTIPFGDKQTATSANNLKSWDAFATSFLPPASTPDDNDYRSTAQLAAAPPATSQQIVKWNAGDGLLQSGNPTENVAGQPWMVDTMFYSFNVGSAIPASQGSVTGTEFTVTGARVGIRPMGIQSELQSPLSISVTDSTGVSINLVDRQITIRGLFDGSPAALWGRTGLDHEAAPDGENMVIPQTLMGLEISAETYLYIGAIPAFPIESLTYTKGGLRLLPFALTPAYSAATPLSQEMPFSQIMASIMESSVVSRRNAIYTALHNITDSTAGAEDDSSAQQLLQKNRSPAIEAPLDADLSVMSTSAELVLQVFPTIAPIGLYQNGGKPTDPVPNPVGPKNGAIPVTAAAIQPPRLEGIIRSYLHSAAGGRRQSMKWTDRRRTSRSVGSNTPLKLHPGGGAVWKLDGRATHTLTIGGRLSALLLAFDQYQQLVGVDRLTPGADHPVLSNVCQLAALSLPASRGRHTGWLQRSKLVKINPLWAIGVDCLVRIQNAQRVRVNRRGKRCGIIDAADLLDRNKVIAADGSLETGWIQTALISTDEYVGVLLSDTSSQSLQVSMARNSLPTSLHTTLPERTVQLGDNHLVIYRLREEARTQVQYLGVLAYQPAPESQILGIISLSGPDIEATTEGQGIDLRTAGLDVSRQDDFLTISISRSRTDR